MSQWYLLTWPRYIFALSLVDGREMFSSHRQDLHGRQLGQSILVRRLLNYALIEVEYFLIDDYTFVIYDFQNLLQSVST